MRRTSCLVVAGGCAMLACVAGCADEQQQIERATSQVLRVAEDLDARTTETGAYKRVEAKDLKEVDPWGTRLDVVYSQGGLAETLVVRSAGPDKQFHTADDLQAGGMTANLQGVGEGVKRNVEEVAAGAAKGAVKGVVRGVKESFKEAVSGEKAVEGPPKAP